MMSTPKITPFYGRTAVRHWNPAVERTSPIPPGTVWTQTAYLGAYTTTKVVAAVLGNDVVLTMESRTPGGRLVSKGQAKLMIGQLHDEIVLKIRGNRSKQTTVYLVGSVIRTASSYLSRSVANVLMVHDLRENWDPSVYADTAGRMAELRHWTTFLKAVFNHGYGSIRAIELVPTTKMNAADLTEDFVNALYDPTKTKGVRVKPDAWDPAGWFEVDSRPSFHALFMSTETLPDGVRQLSFDYCGGPESRPKGVKFHIRLAPKDALNAEIDEKATMWTGRRAIIAGNFDTRYGVARDPKFLRWREDSELNKPEESTDEL